MADIDQIRVRLIAAMKRKRRAGWTLVRDVTLRPEFKECCALGSVLDELPDHDAAVSAETALGLAPYEGGSLIAGFDGTARAYPEQEALYRLGEQLWQEAERLNALAPSEVV